MGEPEDFLDSESALCDTTMQTCAVMCPSKPARRATPGATHNGSCRLSVTMASMWVVDWDKRTLWWGTQMPGEGRCARAKAGVYGKSPCLPLSFAVNLKLL